MSKKQIIREMFQRIDWKRAEHDEKYLDKWLYVIWETHLDEIDEKGGLK